MKTNLAFLLSLLIISGIAHAAPDAGQLLQEIEKQHGTELPKHSLPTLAPTPQPMKPVDGISITINHFIFTGNTIFSSDELEKVVEDYLNRPLSFSDLQQATANVAKAYREAGWIVRVYLPQQDIKKGRITIQIVEAIFGGVKLEGGEPARFDSADAINMIESAQSIHTLLNSDKIDRALLLTNDLPGIAATGTLSKGAGQGETDLIIKLADEPLVSSEISIDNTGSYSTGSERVSASVQINSPLKIGDQLSANLMHSRGNDYVRFSYSLPVGHDGWRVGASTSYLNYKIIKGDFTNLKLGGNSVTIGLNASYPMIRSRLKNLYFGFNYDRKLFDNKSNSVATTNYSIENVSLSFNGNLFDKLGGANSMSLSLVGGDLKLNSQDNRKGVLTNLGGHFTKANYYFSRQQVITDTVSLYIVLSGQQAWDILDSAEKFYLGGVNGVRAYPANEGSGSDGQLVNVELRWRLPKNIVITGFYDMGHVRKTDVTPTSYTLKGAGISASWASDFGLNLNSTWAHRIGNNPNPTANGADQDGTHYKNRFWLQVTTKL